MSVTIAKEQYENWRPYVNGYVKVQSESNKCSVFLRCKVEKYGGCGDPTEDGKQIVEFVQYFMRDPSDYDRVAAGVCKKLGNHYQSSKEYLYSTPEPGDKNAQKHLAILQPRGVETLNDLCANNFVENPNDTRFVPVLYDWRAWEGPQDVDWPSRASILKRHFQWMYLIDLDEKFVEVRRRFSDSEMLGSGVYCELLWEQPFEHVTDDWMEDIEHDRIKAKARSRTSLPDAFSYKGLVAQNPTYADSFKL